MQNWALFARPCFATLIRNPKFNPFYEARRDADPNAKSRRSMR